MPIDHYENFPVASLILPRRLRAPVEAIYHFARTADDLADEGDSEANSRLAQLTELSWGLDRIEAGSPIDHPLLGPLALAVRQHDLPIALLRDLLEAFSQDVVKSRYGNFDELLDYCRRSANPIGRLLLHLFGAHSPLNLAQSDAICTSLQLINLWQDIAVDWTKGRVYLPLDELYAFSVSESQIGEARVNEQWTKLMHFQVARAKRMLKFGSPLGRALSGRTGLELRMIISGGMHILRRIDAVGGDVFRHRPRIKAFDWLSIFVTALLRRS